MKMSSHSDPNKVYEIGDDNTAWYSKVIREGERFNVLVYDGDGDRLTDHEGSCEDLALAVALADRSVLRFAGPIVPAVSVIEALASQSLHVDVPHSARRFAALVGMSPGRFAAEVEGGHARVLVEKIAARFIGPLGASMLDELSRWAASSAGQANALKMHGNVDTYTDGEVVGVDADGSLVQWNAETGEAYNSGETPESFGAHNLSDMERARLQQAVIGQPEGLSLNTDPTLIEARVMKDYAHYLGKDVLVKGICGFVGDDSTDVELSPPAKVRVEATSEQSLKRWIDGWCDPLYEVTLVENHPQLNGMRSLWIHGPSLHLNGKQTEASDIVSMAEQPIPRQDDSPTP